MTISLEIKHLLLLLFVVNGFASEQVGLWDRFETTVVNTNTFNNPFTDVTLNITLTGPNGTKRSAWGFYTGGTTWKIRFMPDRTGKWTYTAVFSDGTEGKSGSFQVVPSEIPGQISLDASNPIWFGFIGGEHVLLRSFHVGDRFFAENWDDPVDPQDGNKRTVFLDWAQAQGYNMFSIASHYLNRETNGRGTGWDTPDLWNKNAQRPNPGEYVKMETILDTLAKRRIIVHPFAGFFGANSDYPTNQTHQTAYLRYTTARIGCYWNILYSVAGPELAKWSLSVSEINRLGGEIKSMDIYNHLLGCHMTKNKNEFQNRNWVTYDCVQGPTTTSLSTLSSGLLDRRSQNAALYAHETLWAGNKNHPDYSDTQLRKNAWVIMMSGATLNFGDMNGNSSSGFTGSLNLSDRRQDKHDIIKRVWDGFETFPFYRLRPHRDLVDRGYCLADPGKTYLVYLDRQMTVNVAVENGPFQCLWINARNTDDRRSGGVTADGKGLTPPKAGDDWLCYLSKNAAIGDQKSVPSQSGLYQNYPNPFNSETKLRFDLSRQSLVLLKVYDTGGRELGTLVHSTFTPGEYTVPFNAGGLASGIYFYKLQTESFQSIRKMVFVQ